MLFADADADGDDVSKPIVERFRAAGHRVAVVRPGSEFCACAADVWTIRRGERDDYARLVREVCSTPDEMLRVVHTWTVSSGQTAGAGFDEWQERGLYSLLALTHALTQGAAVLPVPIAVLSSGVHSIGVDRETVPDKATLIGACKVIPQEHPHLDCRLIDVDAGAAAAEIPRVDRLIAELCDDAGPREVAYRGGDRWVASMHRVEMDGTGDNHAPRLGGVYLVTGGLGSVGFRVAQHLARSRQARVVLMTRGAFPSRDDWDVWLQHHDGRDRVSRAIGAIRESEPFGGELVVLQGDVAREEDMRRVVDETCRRFGALHGVVHAAGVTTGPSIAPINALDSALCREQFVAKVGGLRVLDKVLGSVPLDFCVVMSSLSTLLGGIGLMGYSAANACADSFTLHRNLTGATAWTAIDWDGWEVPADEPRQDEGRALARLTTAEALQAFDRVAECGPFGRIVVAKGDLAARQKWLDASARRAAADVQPAARTRRGTDAVVLDIWQELLGLERIGAHDDFFAIGGDSLAAVQLIARLHAAFDVSIPVDWFFEHSTPQDVANAIAGELGGRAAVGADGGRLRTRAASCPARRDRGRSPTRRSDCGRSSNSRPIRPSTTRFSRCGCRDHSTSMPCAERSTASSLGMTSSGPRSVP